MPKSSIDQVTPTFVLWKFHSGESNTSHGDSGGPLFSKDANGAAQVAGINTGGTVGYNDGWGQVSWDTRVDAIAGWIDGIIGTNTGGGGSNGSTTI